MIYVRDKGRMCNNILQYGHLYAWGRKHGRRTLSMRFAYKYPYFRICGTPGHNFFRYLMGKWGAKLGLIPVVSFHEKDADTSAQESVMLTARNVVAEGWEARFYPEFIEYFDEILSLFAFRPEVEKAADRTMGAAHVDTFDIGIHIRRGDYARWQDGRYFFSDAQYQKVIGRIIECADAMRAENGDAPSDIRVFICGNDPALDEAGFLDEIGKIAHRRADRGGHDHRVEVIFPKGNPAEDLCVLSRCRLLAGPPSTYSLVASMYGTARLYWIMDPEKEISRDDFREFKELFTQII